MNTLLFPHIPKTSGSYVRAYFNSVFTNQQVFWRNDSTFKDLFANYEDFDKVKVFGGHRQANSEYFQHIVSVRPSYAFIFIVRHPIIRFLSHFYHSKRNISHSLYDELSLTSHLLSLNTPFVKKNTRQQLQYMDYTQKEAKLGLHKWAKKYRNVIVLDSTKVNLIFDMSRLLFSSDNLNHDLNTSSLFTNSAPGKNIGASTSVEEEISFYEKKLNCTSENIRQIEELLSEEMSFYNNFMANHHGCFTRFTGLNL